MQKQFRLTHKEDFHKVYKYGKSSANNQFVVYYLPQHSMDHFRLGISVSKKVGNAVVRNHMRRIVKEIVRHHAALIIGSADIILIVRKPAVGMTYIEIEKSILHVMKKAGLTKGHVHQSNLKQQ